MEINYGIKKVWKDLVESKESLKYLYLITGLMLLAGVFDAILKVNLFYSLCNLALVGYFVLMVNNIIHDKKPVLENLGAQNGDDRNLFLIILQIIGISFVYALALIIIGLILFAIFAGALKLSIPISATLMIILLLPLLILTSFYNLLFAENLKFSDAFNLKKAYNSLKLGLPKYLAVFGINILLCFGFVLFLIAVAFPFGIGVAMFFKSYPIVSNVKEVSQLIGRIFGSFIGTGFGIMITYWYQNVTAQIYKYTLSKMNITES